MSTQRFQEVISHREATPQIELPLASEGVLRYVGKSRFGDMLIEVDDGHTYVNGELVLPAFPEQARQVRLS